MKRNRIVIKLGESQKRPGGSRRGLARALVIIAVVLLLLLAGAVGGGYLWWRHYQNSPAYTLAVLADASQRNDTTTVDSILDTDKVTDDFMAQARQHAGGSVASGISSVWPAQTDSALQMLSPRLKQTVHDELVKEVQRLTEPAKGKPFILVALAITRFADIKEENKVAQVKANIKDEHLQLTMQPPTGEGRWRITAVQDDKLVKLVADGMTRTLPGTQVQDEIHKQLDKLKKPAR
jgi:uncharacterized membrane protein